MAGRWKILFFWVVIATAGLIYLASFKLPVVAAIEQAADVASDQLPSLVNNNFGVMISGTGGQEDATATAEPGITESDTIPETESSQTVSPPEEAPVTVDTAADASASDSEAASSTSSEPSALDSSDPAPAVIEPQTLEAPDLLADFMSTRVGLVSAGTFPAHNVDVEGEFVFRTPLINGSQFSAVKGRPIPEPPEVPDYYSALTSYNDGTMNGFELYKNMNYDPYYGDCYLAMSAGGQVSFTNLSMEVTELYGQQLTGVRTFLIPELWTTNPGEDLPLGAGEVPPAPPDDLFSGNNFKVTVFKMTADYIEFPSFSLSVRPGRTQFQN